jgi:hypothetical protein
MHLIAFGQRSENLRNRRRPGKARVLASGSGRRNVTQGSPQSGRWARAFGELTSEAIEGGGAIPLRLTSGRILNEKSRALLRLDRRPCGNATVELANARHSSAGARLRAYIPEGALLRPPTRTARTCNTAWRRFSSGFQPRISGTVHARSSIAPGIPRAENARRPRRHARPCVG